MLSKRRFTLIGHKAAPYAARLRCGFVAAALALACWPHDAGAETVEELRRMLEQRNAEIADLKRRLREAGAAGQPPAPADPPAVPSAVPSAAGTGAVPARVPDARIPVGDDDLHRALERALVDRGGLLLPAGRFELQPALSYSRSDGHSGLPRSADLGASLSLRAGLARGTQMLVSVPYNLRTRIGDEHAGGPGDISVAAAAQLYRQRDQFPALIGSLNWTAPTGRDGFSGGVPLGSGFHAFGASLTALRRLDPLVLVAGISYTVYSAEQVQGREVRPGPVTGLRFGGGLAINPEASFDLGVNLGLMRPTRADRHYLAGSGDAVATLDFGFGMVLSRQVFLRIGSQIRLTGPAPDFGISISLPVRY